MLTDTFESLRKCIDMLALLNTFNIEGAEETHDEAWTTLSDEFCVDCEDSIVNCYCDDDFDLYDEDDDDNEKDIEPLSDLDEPTLKKSSA